MTDTQVKRWKAFAETCPDRRLPPVVKPKDRNYDSDSLLAQSLALSSCRHKNAKVSYCCSSCPAMAEETTTVDMIAETRKRGLLV